MHLATIEHKYSEEIQIGKKVKELLKMLNEEYDKVFRECQEKLKTMHVEECACNEDKYKYIKMRLHARSVMIDAVEQLKNILEVRGILMDIIDYGGMNETVADIVKHIEKGYHKY